MAQSDELKQRYLRCVNLHADAMYRLAFRLTGNAELASDLVQEAFTAAWQGIETLKDPEKMKSWMFTILRFQYTKMLRRIKKTQTLDSYQLEMVPQRETGDQDTQERSRLLQSAINQLEDKFKLPLLMVSMEGLAVTDAAEVLGVPKGTVLSRLHRARGQLKEKLQNHAEFSNE